MCLKTILSVSGFLQLSLDSSLHVQVVSICCQYLYCVLARTTVHVEVRGELIKVDSLPCRSQDPTWLLGLETSGFISEPSCWSPIFLLKTNKQTNPFDKLITLVAILKKIKLYLYKSPVYYFKKRHLRNILDLNKVS